MAGQTIRVLVSIVNWNNTAATNRCLASIAKIDKSQQPDVIVVDNGSKREALAVDSKIAGELRSFKIINNPNNLGFAGGHNPNIELAKRQNYDYVVLLNNDTQIIDLRVFDKLAKALDENPKSLGANPTILSKINPATIWYGGGRLSLVTASASHLRVGRAYNPKGRPTTIQLLTGGCLMIALKRAGIEQLRLSEDYFLYWEDTDWCARARRAGFELLYVPQAKILHEVSSSLGIRSSSYIYYNIRNHYLFITRNLRPWFWPAGWCTIGLISAKYKVNILVRYKKGRWQALKGLWAGTIDGWIGRKGQTRPIE